MAAYLAFLVVWTAAQFLLTLSQIPGAYGLAARSAASLGGRLAVVVGLAMAVPLAATPLAVGRAVGWFLGPIDRLLGLSGLSWRAALALCLMMSFLPRAIAAAKALDRTLRLRAPRLPILKRLRLEGEAMLRILGSQAWEAALAIAARDLWRPEPWRWRR
jgi:biotin transport system permease protein